MGCHESKNSAPPALSRSPQAITAGAQRLTPFWSEKVSATEPLPRIGLSFPRDIQPILDRHCVSCHNGAAPAAGRKPLADLRGIAVRDEALGRAWSRSYLSLTHAYAEPKGERWRGANKHPVLNWVSSTSLPTLQKPISVGSKTSKLFEFLDSGHGKTAISPGEVARLAAWVDLAVPFCGDYVEFNIWTDAEKAEYARAQARRVVADAADAAVLRRLGAGK